MSSNILPGRSFPLGATASPEGVNFCIYSSTCTGLELLLFDSASDSEPSHSFDPERHRSVHSREAPPVLWAIGTDPMLIESKVIAEA